MIIGKYLVVNTTTGEHMHRDFIAENRIKRSYAYKLMQERLEVKKNKNSDFLPIHGKLGEHHLDNIGREWVYTDAGWETDLIDQWGLFVKKFNLPKSPFYGLEVDDGIGVVYTSTGFYWNGECSNLKNEKLIDVVIAKRPRKVTPLINNNKTFTDFNDIFEIQQKKNLDSYSSEYLLAASVTSRGIGSGLSLFPTTFPQQKFNDLSKLGSISDRFSFLQKVNKYKGLTSGFTKTVAGLSIANDVGMYYIGQQSGARTTYHITGTGVALGVGYLVSAPASITVTAVFVVGEKYYDSTEASRKFWKENDDALRASGIDPLKNDFSVEAMENFFSGGEF